MAGELIVPNGIIASGSFIITGSLVSTQDIIVGGSAVVTSNQTGSFGGGSGDKRHDFNVPYSYCGTAPANSLTSAFVWDITRINVSPNGATTKASASNASWDNRYSTIYN